MSPPRLVTDDEPPSSVEGTIAGMPFKVTGSLVVVLLVMFGLGWLLYHELEKQTTYFETMQRLITQQHEQIQMALNAQLWVLCQGNQECRKFDLEMPDALRLMARNNRRTQ